MNGKNVRRYIKRGFSLISKGEFTSAAKLATSKMYRWNMLALSNSFGRRIPGANIGDLFPKVVASKRGKTYPTLNAAVILDDFSFQAWSKEFNCQQLFVKNAEKLAEECDFLFVESAWSGNGGLWKYALTGPSTPSNELIKCVSIFRSHGVPTIFWNKEDPPHFDDFLETARLFDYVFTTDSNLTAEYKNRLGHENVYCLPFAAQPSIQNPIRRAKHSNPTEGDIAFAGTYFAKKFPERKNQLNMLLDAAAELNKKYGIGLTIFSRFENVDKKYRFPKRFSPFVVEALPYERMVTAYQGFKVFLNVNSVINSPSMCARRIFEITACGTPVVTTPSLAIPRFFEKDEISVVDSAEKAKRVLSSLVNSKQLRDRIVHRAQRRIWKNHTFADRAHTVLELVGLDESPKNDIRESKVSVICSSRRKSQIVHLVQQVAQQLDVEIEFLLMTNGFNLSSEERDSIRNQLSGSEVQFFASDESESLGSCLNTLVSNCSGGVIAKMDDDDTYLPWYLRDQLNALFFSGADLVGKQASYLWFEENGMVVLRNPDRENTWTKLVAGPTLTGLRATFLETPFKDISQGEDTEFLGEIYSKGRSIYSTDRFNFVQNRSSGDHTWKMDLDYFTSSGRVEMFGDPVMHVEC